MRQLLGLDVAGYTQHPLHAGSRVWSQTNCYVDLWIEVLHANGLEPLAALGFTASVDLEGDQWTFFKYPLADLYRLYGIDVFELNIWDSLQAHLEEQLRLGRLPIVETDAWFLPDTHGVSYRTEHAKTSIAIQQLDPRERRMAYFHNAGYYELFGDDFTGVMEFGGRLPPYVEVARLGAQAPLSGPGLLRAAGELLEQHLLRRPADNPFRRYAERFLHDVEDLRDRPLGTFHGYAFSGLRQCGAAFELLASHLRWLEAAGGAPAADAAEAYDGIATAAKALQFKTARFVSTGKRFDPAPLLDEMASRWDRGMGLLGASAA